MRPLNLPLNATFSVVVAPERDLERGHMNDVVRWFERYPGPVTVQAARRPPTTLALNDEGEVPWETAFTALRELRAEQSVSPDAFVVLLTKSPNERNWYAVQNPANQRDGFVHAGDFRWATSAPSSAISAHFILKGIFNALLGDAEVDWTTLRHDEPRGCLFDFCASKDQLNLKLRTADICGDCMHVFREIGIPDSLLQQTVLILEACRDLSLNTGQFRSRTSAFERWPFPVAVTRHKVVQASNPVLKFLLLLDHFDSLVRYFCIVHSVRSGKNLALVDKPSLGWWLEQLAHSLSGQAAYREVVSIAQREKVVALRNEKRGHGWMAAKSDSYAALAARLEGIVGLIEEEMAPFFESHRLVIPRAVEPRNGIYVVSGDELMGSNLLHPPLEGSLSGDPLSVGLSSMNDVFVSDPRLERFHGISPYIRSATCPECHHDRILITDGVGVYIDVFVGHRVTLEPSGPPQSATS